MKIVPIRGAFEDPRTLLLHVAEDEEIESFCMVVFTKDGRCIPAHIGCSLSDMAFAGALLTKMAIENPADF